MGREVRMVPANWQHPKNENGYYISLFEGDKFEKRAAEWDEECAKWDRGEFPDYVSEKSKTLSFEQYEGRRPNADHYMPNWPKSERTHLMMYETCSEGTPISPAFETPEELAKWLYENEASAFGSSTASYEGWLRVAQGGYAPSAVIADGRIISGVDAG